MDLPFFKSANSFLPARLLLGGWQVSGFTIIVSGEPLTVTIGGAFPTGDFNGDGTAGDRPDAPASNIQMSGWNRNQFMNGIFRAADFPRPAPGTNGNLGRNTVRGPGFRANRSAICKDLPVQ